MAIKQDSPFTDLTLQFSDEIQRVHKVALYEYSGWFRAALTSEFQEATAELIRLEEDDAKAVKAMLQHCYSGDYGTTRAAHCEVDMHHFIFDAQMFCLADKYEIDSLAEDILVMFEYASNDTEPLNYHALCEALDQIYILPAGSFVDKFREMFRPCFKFHVPEMVREVQFKSLHTKYHMFASDCLLVLGEIDELRFIDGFTCEGCHREYSVSSDEFDGPGGGDTCPFCMRWRQAGDLSPPLSRRRWISGYLYMV